MGMKIVGRERRKLRIRKKVEGTPERPRLSVFRSSKHIYAQVIDDVTGKTLAHASTLSKDLKGTLDKDKKIDAAKKVGALIAKICKSKKIDRVVFDLRHGLFTILAEITENANEIGAQLGTDIRKSCPIDQVVGFHVHGLYLAARLIPQGNRQR